MIQIVIHRYIRYLTCDGYGTYLIIIDSNKMGIDCNFIGIVFDG